MKKILVIDDDETLRDVYSLILEDTFEVHLAEDGQEGVEAFERVQPDLVFLDLKMPRMNGVQALKAIRAMDASTPVYIVTAFAKEFMDQLLEAQELGLEFQIANKPLSDDQIMMIAEMYT